MEIRYPGVVVPERLIGDNAFTLLSEVRRGLKDVGADAATVEEFFREAMSGDYQHLIDTVTQRFTVE